MLTFTIPQTTHTDFTPRITVVGVGGGGTNAVDNMIALNLRGVEFIVANTDAQQLAHSKADRRIQLGPHLTQGLGAGAKPEIGRAAAEEAADELVRHLDGVHMVFITAGMGGGTGTGAAPVIARMARERGILTVGVVTKPFTFEGAKRTRSAESGILELQQYVDTLIVIPNQNLFRLANERTGWREAFKMADHVLYMGVRGVTDLMVAPGLVNLDFADIRTVMAEMGKAMMGTGEAEGENRAIRAAESAISNPLLEDTNMEGARGLLINITGGEDMTLFEVDQAANRIREEVSEDANIIFGSAIDESLAGRVRVSVVATGIESATQQAEAEQSRLRLVSGGNPVAVGQGAPPNLVQPNYPTSHQANHQANYQANPGHPTSAPIIGASGGAAQYAASQGQAAALGQHPGHPNLHPISAPPQSFGQTPGRLPTIGGALGQAAYPAARVAESSLAAQASFADPSTAPVSYLQAPAAMPQPRGLQQQPAQSPRAAASRGAPAGGNEAMTGVPPQPTATRSLFGLVTGALRRAQGGATPDHEPADVARQEPSFPPATFQSPTFQARASAQPAAPQYAEPPRQDAHPTPQITASEEMGLDIPAFLRRQTSH